MPSVFFTHLVERSEFGRALLKKASIIAEDAAALGIPPEMLPKKIKLVDAVADKAPGWWDSFTSMFATKKRKPRKAKKTETESVVENTPPVPEVATPAPVPPPPTAVEVATLPVELPS